MKGSSRYTGCPRIINKSVRKAGFLELIKLMIETLSREFYITNDSIANYDIVSSLT